MRAVVRSFLSVAVLLVFASAAAAAPFFTGLPYVPGGTFAVGSGVSANGSVAVGWSFNSTVTDEEAFRWTASGGTVGIGDGLNAAGHASEATAVSGDGTTVVGNHEGFHAFRWTQATGIADLGSLGGLDRESAYAVSGNGSVVVGQANSLSGPEAFRWTSTTGMVGLGDLPGGPKPYDVFYSWATGVSGDGSVVVGVGNYDLDTAEAFRWTLAKGMVGLGWLPGGPGYSVANAVSADGSTVVGSAASVLSGFEAFRWTAASGMVGLGSLPGFSNTYARGVSGDGSRIVGQAASSGADTAIFWDEAGGMRTVKSVLQNEFGLNLSGWTLVDASAISADGTTIVGTGIDPFGAQRAWIAMIPEPGTLLLLGSGLAGLVLFGRSKRG
jgi:probable HAF family extracellular repeat protein